MTTNTPQALRETRDELGSLENTSFIPKTFTEQVKLKSRTHVIALHQSDSPNELGFQFDSGSLGIMGENTFGVSTDTPVSHYHVLNYNNTWEWDIDTATIINGSNKVTRVGFTDYDLTTATEDVNTGTITINAGEIWTSHPIYRDGNGVETISEATFTGFGGTVLAPSGSLIWEYGIVPLGQGLLWFPFTWGTTVTFVPSTELRIRARVI